MKRATWGLLAVLAAAPSAKAGPWPGAPSHRVVVRFGAEHDTASERFCAGDARDCIPGTRVAFDTTLGGAWRQNAATLSIDAGLSERIAVGATANVVDVRYADRVGVRTSSGIGDVTCRVHAGVTLSPVASAFDVRVKAPTAHEPASAQFLRLSDGQWDIEITASIGRSFWPAPAYAFLESGYRIRTTSARFSPALDVGDEWTVHAESGVSIARRASLRARITGFAGADDRAGLVRVPGRRLVQMEPSAAWALPHGGEVEITGTFALAGRGTAATHGIRVSYAAPPWRW